MAVVIAQKKGELTLTNDNNAVLTNAEKTLVREEQFRPWCISKDTVLNQLFRPYRPLKGSKWPYRSSMLAYLLSIFTQACQWRNIKN
jgi:hypothetical protein